MEFQIIRLEFGIFQIFKNQFNDMSFIQNEIPFFK